MGAKLKSKTYLLNTFFYFLSRFLASKFEKNTNMAQKNFFSKKIKKSVKKRRISRWFRIRWKSFKKMHKKKVLSKTSLTNMSKSEKSAFFRHVFATNFFLVNFFKTFSTDSKSAWNSAFFDTFSNFQKLIFLGHISTFFELRLQMRRKRLKKTENLFMNVS
jgi:hypothetical protein